MSSETYILDSPESPWGDYGAILTHGMTGYEARGTDGLLRLYRTGPYIPPVTFPGLGDTVVTEKVRRLLTSTFPELLMRPVNKVRIVELNWHRWDASAQEPRRYPAGGEPENYLLKGRHSESTSRLLGSLWEVVPQTAGTGDYYTLGYTRVVSRHLAQWLRAEVDAYVTLSAR